MRSSLTILCKAIDCIPLDAFLQLAFVLLFSHTQFHLCMLIVLSLYLRNIQRYILTMLTRYTQVLLFLTLYNLLDGMNQVQSLFARNSIVVACVDLDHTIDYSHPTHSTLTRIALVVLVRILPSLDF